MLNRTAGARPDEKVSVRIFIYDYRMVSLEAPRASLSRGCPQRDRYADPSHRVTNRQQRDPSRTAPTTAHQRATQLINSILYWLLDAWYRVMLQGEKIPAWAPEPFILRRPGVAD